MDDLLIGRRRRLRPPPGVVDQHLDRRAVDNIERNDLTAAIAADLESWCVEHQDILEHLAQPSRERLLAVGLSPKLRQCPDTRRCIGRRAFLVAKPDRPIEFFDLVLTRFDREPGNVVVLRQRAKLMEVDRLIGARRIDRVVANREIPHPNPLTLRWNERIAWRENPLIGLKDVAEPGNVVLCANAAPSVRGERLAVGLRLIRGR